MIDHKKNKNCQTHKGLRKRDKQPNTDSPSYILCSQKGSIMEEKGL
jgi:hypothetical protein